MSGKKPLNEKPLTQEAVSWALSRVVGGKTTDQEKYLRYQNEVARRRPGYWSQIQRIGDFCERSARMIDYPAQLQIQTVIGGGLIYLASAEEQAALERRYVPPIPFLKAEKAFYSLAISNKEGQEEVKEVGVSFGELLTTEEKALTLDTGFKGRLDVFRAMDEQRQAAFDPDTDLAEKAKRAAGYMLKGLTLGSVDFLRKETNFVKVMNEWWWNDIDPQVLTGQLIGATVTRQMIWPSWSK